MSLPSITSSFPDLNLIGGISYDVQTVDDTPTLLFGQNLEDGTAIKFNASVQAISDDALISSGYERNILITRNGVSASLGIPHSPFTDKSGNPALACFWQVTGTQAQLMVQGLLGVTINWTAKVSFQPVSI